MALPTFDDGAVLTRSRAALTFSLAPPPTSDDASVPARPRRSRGDGAASDATETCPPGPPGDPGLPVIARIVRRTPFERTPLGLVSALLARGATSAVGRRLLTGAFLVGTTVIGAVAGYRVRGPDGDTSGAAALARPVVIRAVAPATPHWRRALEVEPARDRSGDITGASEAAAAPSAIAPEPARPSSAPADRWAPAPAVEPPSAHIAPRGPSLVRLRTASVEVASLATAHGSNGSTSANTETGANATKRASPPARAPVVPTQPEKPAPARAPGDHAGHPADGAHSSPLRR